MLSLHLDAGYVTFGVRADTMQISPDTLRYSVAVELPIGKREGEPKVELPDPMEELP